MSIALIVAIVGALAYLLLDRVERLEAFAELGRLAFLAGLLAFLLK
jgi:hypothetical protein